MKMKHLFIAALALSLCSFGAMADLPMVAADGIKGFDGSIDLGGTGTRGTVVYSNTTNGPTAAYANVPGTQLGDDLLTTAAGTWDDIAFSVYNSSASTSQLVSADLTVYMYNWDGAAYAFAGGAAFGTVALALDPGFFTTLSAGSLAALEICLSDDLLAILVIDNDVWAADPGDVGQILMDPPTVGSSLDQAFEDGTWFWFGGDPVANFYWEVGVIEDVDNFDVAIECNTPTLDLPGYADMRVVVTNVTGTPISVDGEVFVTLCNGQVHGPVRAGTLALDALETRSVSWRQPIMPIGEQGRKTCNCDLVWSVVATEVCHEEVATCIVTTSCPE